MYHLVTGGARVHDLSWTSREVGRGAVVSDKNYKRAAGCPCVLRLLSVTAAPRTPAMSEL